MQGDRTGAQTLATTPSPPPSTALRRRGFMSHDPAGQRAGPDTPPTARRRSGTLDRPGGPREARKRRAGGRPPALQIAPAGSTRRVPSKTTPFHRAHRPALGSTYRRAAGTG